MDDVAEALVRVAEVLGCQATAFEPAERAKALVAENERLRAAAPDPKKITQAVLDVIAKGGDNLAIFEAVKRACEQQPDGGTK